LGYEAWKFLPELMIPKLDSYRFRMWGALDWRGDIAFVRHARAHGNVSFLLSWRPSSKAIYVAVVHAEGGGNQDRVVNLNFGCTFFASASDVFRGDSLAALLNVPGDVEKCFELG
jgi:hypothetical protein